MLNIFHTGGLTLALTIVWLGLTGWFLYQAYVYHNSGWTQDRLHYHAEGDEKIPYWRIPFFWGAVAVTVAYIVAMLFVASDYKGV